MVYPACGAYFTKENQEQSAVVVANSNSNNPAEIAAVLDISFGVAFLIAFTIHAACVEIYVRGLFTDCGWCYSADVVVAQSDI